MSRILLESTTRHNELQGQSILIISRILRVKRRVTVNFYGVKSSGIRIRIRISIIIIFIEAEREISGISKNTNRKHLLRQLFGLLEYKKTLIMMMLTNIYYQACCDIVKIEANMSLVQRMLL